MWIIIVIISISKKGLIIPIIINEEITIYFLLSVFHHLPYFSIFKLLKKKGHLINRCPLID